MGARRTQKINAIRSSESRKRLANLALRLVEQARARKKERHQGKITQPKEPTEDGFEDPGETFDIDDIDDLDLNGSDDQPIDATGSLDEEGSPRWESSTDHPQNLSDSEGDIAYEHSFDKRVVRLGKLFVLCGCPWIKGGEWDAVEAEWNEPDDLDDLGPTSLLKKFLKQEGIAFQTWRKEGFEGAFLEGMRTMRSDAVATIKRNGEEIFNIHGVDFKSKKVRRENSAIRALCDGNKFLTSMSPTDKIRPMSTPEQVASPQKQRKEASCLADGYLYHPCIPRAMRAFLLGPSAIRSLDDLDTIRSRPRAYKLNIFQTTISTLSFITMIIYFVLSGAFQLEPKSSDNMFDFDGFFNMRLQSLSEMKKARPNHFHKLIEHYDLLVFGQSGRHRLLGTGDAEAQMKYQASLLKSMSEMSDSSDSGGEDQGGGESGDDKGGTHADNVDENGEWVGTATNG